MKILSIKLLLISVVVLSLLAACGNNGGGAVADTTGGGGTQAQTGETTDEETTEAPPSADPDGPFAEHLTISMSIMEAHIAGRDIDTGTRWSPTMQYIMDRFNVSFDFYALDWGDFLEVQRMWLASGTAPDVLFYDVAPVRYGEFFINATRNGFYRPYNLANLPNMQAAFASAPAAAHAFMIDGNLYAWPGIIDLTVMAPYRLEGFVYRKDWAREVGHAQPDSIYTYDQWIDMVRAVQEQNPGDVAGGVFGVASINWMMPRDWPTSHMAPGITEYVFDESIGEYTWGPLLPHALEVVQRLNQHYHDGLIWPDQIMARDDEAFDLFFEGRLFAAINSGIIYGSFVDRIEDFLEFNDMDFEDYDLVTYYAQNVIGHGLVESPLGGIHAPEMGGVWSQTVMTAGISDAHAERWEAILDFLVSEEGYFMRNFGLRGEHWDFDENGDFVLMWEIDEHGRAIDPLGDYLMWIFNRVAGNSDAAWLMNVPEVMNQEMLRQYLALIDVVSGPRANRVPFDLELQYFTGERFLEVGSQSVGDQITALLVADPDDVERLWNEFIDSRMHLIQPVLDEINAALLDS